MLTDSIGTGGKWGTGTQIMPGNRPTMINGKIYKYKEKKATARDNLMQRKKGIQTKMNSD